MAQPDEQLSAFLSELDEAERWTASYLAQPALTSGERATAYSLRGYLADSRLYALGPNPTAAELDRLRKKIERVRYGVHLAWVASGRRCYTP